MSSLEQIDDAVAAAAFRRLVRHLRHRTDAPNIELMALSGFCRNCLSDWIADESARRGNAIEKNEAREAIYGMPYAEWKANHQADATPEQLERMRKSMTLNPDETDLLDQAASGTFPPADAAPDR